MQRNRPAAVLVLAILHLVAGGLGLLNTLCGAGFYLAGVNKMFAPAPPGGPQAAQVQSQQDFQKRLEQHMAQQVPYQQAAVPVAFGFDLLLDILLLIGGIGLLLMQPWARVLSLIYAVLSILGKILTLANLLITFPVMNAFIQQEVQRDPNLKVMGALMPAIMIGTMVLTLVFMVYPVAVLIILTRPSIAAAFREPALPPAQEWEAETPRPDRWEEPPSDANTR